MRIAFAFQPIPDGIFFPSWNSEKTESLIDPEASRCFGFGERFTENVLLHVLQAARCLRNTAHDWETISPGQCHYYNESLLYSRIHAFVPVVA